MAFDQEFLLYQLDRGEDPVCPRCGERMLIAARLARDARLRDFRHLLLDRQIGYCPCLTLVS